MAYFHQAIFFCVPLLLTHTSLILIMHSLEKKNFFLISEKFIYYWNMNIFCVYIVKHCRWQLCGVNASRTEMEKVQSNCKLFQFPALWKKVSRGIEPWGYSRQQAMRVPALGLHLRRPHSGMQSCSSHWAESVGPREVATRVRASLTDHTACSNGPELISGPVQGLSPDSCLWGEPLLTPEADGYPRGYLLPSREELG